MSADETHISVPENVPQEGDQTERKSKPISGSQAAHLKMLSGELGVPVDLNITGEEAARKIDELEKKAPRSTPKDS